MARIGGDEFAVLLPHTSLAVAGEVAERLRGAIEDMEIVFGAVRTRVTASLGPAEAQVSSLTWDHLHQSCDYALYAAKRAGGNLAAREIGQRTPSDMVTI